MESKFKLLITEENVDGCGDYAQTAVSFDRKLESDEIDAFSVLLHEIKREAAKKDECLDTDDMVQEALNRFEATASGEITSLADAFTSF